MVHYTPEAFITLLTKTANAFVALVTFLILKFVLELDFHCSCSRGFHMYDIVYIVLPPLIILFLGYVVDWNQNGKICHGRCSFIKLMKLMLHIVLASTFWLSAVFLDGDWFACYMAKHGNMTMDLPCKENEMLSYEDTQSQKDAKKSSMAIGLFIMVGFVLVWALYTCMIRCRCSKPNCKSLYQFHLSQETEAYLTEELKKLAQKKARRITRKALEEIHQQEIHQIHVGDDPWHTISDILLDQSLHNEQPQTTGSPSQPADSPSESVDSPSQPANSPSQPANSPPSEPAIRTSHHPESADSPSGPADSPSDPANSPPSGPAIRTSHHPESADSPSESADSPSGPANSPSGPAIRTSHHPESTDSPSGPAESPSGPAESEQEQSEQQNLNASIQTSQSTSNPTRPSTSKTQCISPLTSQMKTKTWPSISNPTVHSMPKQAATLKREITKPAPPAVPPKPHSSAIPPKINLGKQALTKSQSAALKPKVPNSDAEEDIKEPFISNQNVKRQKTTKSPL
ncbi:proteoglycan 4-like [Sardina pilchardus]|uniref:proteoglycan 4-like n=1 Tax=Sardina pilchardus TaxID=27697 RepID=UPI002E115B4F